MPTTLTPIAPRFSQLAGSYHGDEPVTEGFFKRYTLRGRDPAQAGTNLYEYCDDNPTNAADPMGLWRYVPGMGKLNVSLNQYNKRGFQASFILLFDRDKAAFESNAHDTCCAKISFVQIARVKINGSTLGKGADWGLLPWNPPLNQWFVDSDKPPYYPFDEGSGDLNSPNAPSMHDTPGPTVGWWRLQDLSYEFETAVVCSKSKAKDGSNKGVGDVFGSVQWGFSYYVQGPFWNRQTVARKMYINNMVWTDAEMKKITVSGMGGNEQVETGGPHMGGYRGYVPLREPSEEMKKVLSKYFP